MHFLCIFYPITLLRLKYWSEEATCVMFDFLFFIPSLKNSQNHFWHEWSHRFADRTFEGRNIRAAREGSIGPAAAKRRISFICAWWMMLRADWLLAADLCSIPQADPHRAEAGCSVSCSRSPTPLPAAAPHTHTHARAHTHSWVRSVSARTTGCCNLQTSPEPAEQAMRAHCIMCYGRLLVLVRSSRR